VRITLHAVHGEQCWTVAAFRCGQTAR
jgi:hypothetical protein